MNEKERIRTSKFLSLVLRHEPEKIGLKLDPNGWADVEALLAGCRSHGKQIGRAELEEVVATNEKKRFAFSEDGRSIRAQQGHSVEIELDNTPQTPPPRLYHGTASRFVEPIRAEGLHKRERHHVHLSADAETAECVGQRHGRPVVLVVRAAEMHARGHAFFRSGNGVWLTDQVPPEFLEFPDAVVGRKTGGAQRPVGASLAQETVEICNAGWYSAPSGARVEIDAALRQAKDGTRPHAIEGVGSAAEGAGTRPARLEVTGETTIAALQRLHAEEGGHLACLNFASAKNPGGGFLRGADAQEESLARSSGLYPCLLAAPEYYQRNRAFRSTLYLDLAIWSPLVPFFRDDRGRLLEHPVLASVLTCPAPNAGAIATNEPARLNEVEPVLRRRAAFVLALAAEYRVRRFVLGAWGCGVFRNDPVIVARAFSELLREGGQFSRAFDQVVFAVYDRSADQSVLRAFQAAFP